MSDLMLSADQQRAYEAFCQLIQDPIQSILVIEGYAGTGKSFLIRKCVQDLHNLLKTIRLLKIQIPDYQLHLTATTNKAVETLISMTGQDAQTIYSLLGLRIKTDYSDMSTSITLNQRAQIIEDAIIFIDEAGLVNHQLLEYISMRTRRCKIIFVGDPAQLLDIKSKTALVFARDYPKVTMTEVIRQSSGSPVLELATAFRHTVNTGEFFSFKPDNQHVYHLDHLNFYQAIINEFTRPDWKESSSRVLAWTNNRVIAYNKAIYSQVNGTPKFKKGDYAICNSYMSKKAQRIKTGQMVCISAIKPGEEEGVPGYHVEVDCGKTPFFLPENFTDKKKALKAAQQQRNFNLAKHIDQHWIDLRAVYASTINKAQGSTFDRVFIDLDDIKRCTNGNQIARLLYVGVSRAREQVYLTGDLV